MSWPPVPDDLHAIAVAQREELMSAKAMDNDLDLAFHLQLQEALAASLYLQPSSSTSPPPPPVQYPLPQEQHKLEFTDLQSDELLKFEQEHKDLLISAAEYKKIREDLHRRLHDQKVAHEISRVTDDEWEEWGDNFERPYGEGSSSSGFNSCAMDEEVFRVYFKGLIDTDTKMISKSGKARVVFCGVGVAICDSKDDVLFELRKPVNGVGMSRQTVELKALIEGLSAAIALDLKRVVFYCDYYTLYQHVTGRWAPKQRKVVELVNQVMLLRQKFRYSHPILVARNDVKFAFKLAKEAIVSQINKPETSTGSRNLLETCVICLEDTDVSLIFSVDGCMHRYCYSCMKQHVEVKLLHGIVPQCPHEGCNSELKIESCGKFLTPKLIEMMSQRIKEASIPVTEKVYCPYPKCSALMSKAEVLQHSRSYYIKPEISGIRKCMKCNGNFCINCKVRWHNKMTCFEYKLKNPNSYSEDVKLKTLAARNLWRQCVKCNHMIELAAGCYHITCRCGYEFCYTCGAEWKDKKATCNCKLWDERNILDDEEEEEEEELSDEEDYDYDLI